MENTLSILNNIFFWVIFATVALALINYAVRKYNARILPNKGGGLKCFSLSEFSMNDKIYYLIIAAVVIIGIGIRAVLIRTALWPQLTARLLLIMELIGLAHGFQLTCMLGDMVK